MRRQTGHPCGRAAGGRGFALVLVLILVAVATVIGGAYVSAAVVRRSAVKNLAALEQARYAAESGLQHGLELFQRDPSSVIGHSAGPFTLSAGGATYVVSATCLNSGTGLYRLTSTATAGGLSRTAESKVYWWSTYYATARGLGPLGYWRLGETSGPWAYDDKGWQVGVYRTGMSPGAAGAINADSNRAAWFDGSTGYVDLLNANPTGGLLSLAAWVRADAWANSNPRIVSKANGLASPYWELYVVRKTGMRGALTFRLATGSTRVLKTLTSSTDLVVGRWTLVAGTYNKTTGQMKLYQDGVLVASTTHSGDIASSSSINSWIGACAGNGLPWYGAIDEVMIFQKELTDTEIRTLYKKRLGDLALSTWSN